MRVAYVLCVAWLIGLAYVSVNMLETRYALEDRV
jgi:hypothetical protein